MQKHAVISAILKKSKQIKIEKKKSALHLVAQNTQTGRVGYHIKELDIGGADGASKDRQLLSVTKINVLIVE